MSEAAGAGVIHRAEKELIETVWSEYETAMGFFDNGATIGSSSSVPGILCSFGLSKDRTGFMFTGATS